MFFFHAIISVFFFLKIFHYLDIFVMKHNEILDLVGLHGKNKYNCFVSFRFVSFRFVSFRFVSFRFVSFCFVLFCFVLFCFVLFCFVLFCFVLFCFVHTFISLPQLSRRFRFKSGLHWCYNTDYNVIADFQAKLLNYVQL